MCDAWSLCTVAFSFVLVLYYTDVCNSVAIATALSDCKLLCAV